MKRIKIVGKTQPLIRDTGPAQPLVERKTKSMAMDDDKFDRTLDAGVDLYNSIREILERYGLDDEYAASLISVAAGGVFRLSNDTLGQFVDGIMNCAQMWRADEKSTDLLNAVFDPPHRRRN